MSLCVQEGALPIFLSNPNSLFPKNVTGVAQKRRGENGRRRQREKKERCWRRGGEREREHNERVMRERERERAQ